MSKTETEKYTTIEIGKILCLDPAGLMNNNPAALIVNKESYQRMEAHFSPEQFDPPQVVKVKTFTSDSIGDIKYFVIDGLTRIKFISDHKNVALPDYPNFNFEKIPVREVTQSLLKNPLVVDKRGQQNALTMVQYLRAVIPPTIEHSEIASDRITAHLINGWGNMVGEQLSKKFSALAAISALTSPRVPTATDELLSHFLENQEKLFKEETKEERIKLQTALCEMGTIIRESKLFKEQILGAAFALVSKDSLVIGGEKEAQKQIYGLLYIPEVEKKLYDAFPQIGDQEGKRLQLAETISKAFKKFSQIPDGQRIINELHQVLKDQYLQFSHVVDIFNSSSPIERYEQVRKEVNRDRLLKYYLHTEKKYEVGNIESLLIDHFGKKTFLGENELPLLAVTIGKRNLMWRNAEKFSHQLNTEREKLLKLGVKPELIDNPIKYIKAFYEENIASVQSLQRTSSKQFVNLEEMILESERRISYQIKNQKMKEIIDEIYVEEQKTESWLVLKEKIFYFLHGQEIDFLSEEKELIPIVRKKLMELKGLDKDLQSDVIGGQMTLGYATNIQKKRQQGITDMRQFEDDYLTIPQVGRIESKWSSHRPAMSSKIPLKREINLPEEGVTTEEETKKQIENQKLVKGTAVYRDLLYQLKLRFGELSQENKNEIDFMLKKLGRLRFNHQDIVTLIEKYINQNDSSE